MLDERESQRELPSWDLTLPDRYHQNPRSLLSFVRSRAVQSLCRQAVTFRAGQCCPRIEDLAVPSETSSRLFLPLTVMLLHNAIPYASYGLSASFPPFTILPRTRVFSCLVVRVHLSMQDRFHSGGRARAAATNASRPPPSGRPFAAISKSLPFRRRTWYAPQLPYLHSFPVACSTRAGRHSPNTWERLAAVRKTLTCPGLQHGAG